MRERTAAPVGDIIYYDPGKPVEELERELGIEGAVKLASNENPLGPSPRAMEAVRRAMSGVHRYPDGSGYYLKGALARHHGLSRGHFVLGNGTNEVLELLAHAFLDPGDEVVLAECAFVVFSIVAQLSRARRVIVPLRGLTHDLGAMAERVTERTKLVFVANPNNPTGTAVGREEVERFLARVPERALVVFDEAYWHYVSRPDFPDTLAYLRERRNIVVTRTFSKAYGLAGLRVGYGVMDPEVAGYLNRVREPFNVNALALVAAEAALEDVEHVERSVRLNREGKEYLYRALDSLEVPFVPTEGNFLLVEVGDGRATFEALLRRGVIVRPMGGYGLPRHVRVTIGLPEGNRRFIEALQAIREGG
ncbi:MAG: histidinol-phosphate transaminase [Nitrospinota bacterium]